MSKRYLSLWLPRLAVDRIERDQPNLRALPMAVIMAEQGRIMVLSVNALAGQAGVAPGMTLSDGRTLCPILRAAEADLPGDRAAFEQLVRWCVRYTPWAAMDPASATAEGGLLLDVTGCAHLFGGEDGLLTDLSERLTKAGLTHRMAVAGTVGAAWALSRFGPQTEASMGASADSSADWPVLPPGPLHDALAPLPAQGLRLPAADVETLARLGLYRIGDLYGIPRAALTVRFGAGIRRRLDQALGHEAEAISPAPSRTPLRVSRAFSEPLLQPEAMALVLDDLLVRLCARLEADGQGARQLAFTICRADGTAAEAGIGVSRPSRDPAHLARLFAPKLETLDPDPGIDMLVLSAETSDPHQPAQRAFKGTAQAAQVGGPPNTQPDKQTGEHTGHIDELIDRLANRLGGDAVFWQAPRETPVPEKQIRPTPALTRPRPDWSTWPSDLIAPPRLFAQPEPVEPVPSGNGPPENSLENSTAPPDRFVWRHQLWRRRDPAYSRASPCIDSYTGPDTGPYAGMTGPTRLLGPWWDDDATARDYFLVETESISTPGPDSIARLWLFQDLATRRWHVHGVFG